MKMSDRLALTAADYAIVGVMLTISAGIGLYFRIFGGKQTTNDEYLFAGRDMSIFPVAFSMMATFMSTIALMGIPSEMYIYGTNMAFMSIGFLVGPIISSFVFLPIYFKTGVSTTNEYLERRFGKSTRWFLSIISLFHGVLYNAICMYGPALALSAVTNLSMWTSVLTIGIVCTFYSALGGIKAVLWTDAFQTVLMYVCLFAIIVKGCLDLGGIQNIFETAYGGGRIILPTIKMDFSRMYTMWNIIVQSFITAICCYGSAQTHVQRQLTLKSLKRSRIAVLLSSPMLAAFHLLCCLCGIIIYVHFKTCDPITSPTKPIHSADQLVPYYITSAMRQYPGLPGLCIAGIFSASMSTISSSVNSMAAVTYEDIIRPFYPNPSASIVITKISSVVYGALFILLAFLVASIGTLIKANILIGGMVAGPTLGLYLLAAFTTTTNEMGANLGTLAGFAFGGWATFVSSDRHYPHLPVENNCSLSEENKLNYTETIDFSMANVTSLPSDIPRTDDIRKVFPVSYMWISSISLLVCITVGYLGSWICSYIPGQSKPISPELLSPVLQCSPLKHLKTKIQQENEEMPKDSVTCQEGTTSRL